MSGARYKEQKDTGPGQGGGPDGQFKKIKRGYGGEHGNPKPTVGGNGQGNENGNGQGGGEEQQCRKTCPGDDHNCHKSWLNIEWTNQHGCGGNEGSNPQVKIFKH